MSWVALSITAISAGFQIQAGRQQAASLKGQAAGAEMEARIAELGVKQTAARRMEGLLADLGAIQTRRATQNVAVGGSALVGEQAYEKEYLTGLRSDILNQRYGIVAKRTEASSLRSGAHAANLSGYASAISTMAGGFQKWGGGAPGAGGG
jgi:hypothetical protein